MGDGSSASSTTAPVASIDFTQSRSSRIATSASRLYNTGVATSSSTTAYVALQEFVKIPTPDSGHGTTSIAPGYENCYCEYPNQTNNSCVHGGSTNLSEQYVDEVPKSYGFNDLISQSVILADGMERRYYVLSEDYPLNQVTPPMPSSAVGKVGVTAAQSVAAQAAGLPPVLCSKANITTGSGLLVPNLPQPAKVQDAAHLFKEPPVYDIYEEDNSCLNCMDEQLATPLHKASENALSEQLLTCFSKAPETEQTNACLNIVTDVLDVTLEKQQQDDEKRANCSVIMASDSVVTWSSHFSIEHNLRELTLLWDPGASAFLHSSKGSTLSILQQLHNKKISSMQEFSLEKESHVQWDPGIKFILYELRWWSKRTEICIEAPTGCEVWYSQLQ